MPRASRRRRRPPGRGLGQSVLIAIAATVTVVLIGGSLLAIHTQSSAYRSATTSGYVALADRIGQTSTATGARLSTLIAGVPTLADGTFPQSARGVLQQGLDAAVLDTGIEARQAQNLASPPPDGGMEAQFTQVMVVRAAATLDLRTTVDALLGMQPLPVAGEPSSTAPSSQATLISASQAATEMAVEGSTFEQADRTFAQLRTSVTELRPRAHLRPSVWVPSPVDTAPLGSTQLSATAAVLASSTALVPFHHLVITAVGLTPPAVPTGGVGTESTSCAAPLSTSPGAAPTVVPPTTTLGVLVSVTNCGNVPEAGVTVTETVAVADPPGLILAPAGLQGGRVQAVVTLASGASVAPALGALSVGAGHRYLVTVSVSLPPGQADPAGSSQKFLVQVTG